MCVLIIKPQGVKMPSQKILTACTQANPHGFGIATPNSIFKTLNSKEFLNECKNISKEVPAILHCRLATHGSIKVSNCHPFIKDNWIFAHNGILNTVYCLPDKTDSESAFLQIFLPLIKANGIENENTKAVINAVKGFSSKFAFMDKTTSKIYHFGEFVNIQNVLFSNTRWRIDDKKHDYFIKSQFYKKMFQDEFNDF